MVTKLRTSFPAWTLIAALERISWLHQWFWESVYWFLLSFFPILRKWVYLTYGPMSRNFLSLPHCPADSLRFNWQIETSASYVPQISMVCIILYGSFWSFIGQNDRPTIFPCLRLDLLTVGIWLSFIVEMIVYYNIIYYFWQYIISM